MNDGIPVETWTSTEIGRPWTPISVADGTLASITTSLEPSEFRAMVSAIRVAEAALGAERYEPSEREARGRRYRRSLYAVTAICAGEAFTFENVRSIRPGFGLAPKHLPEILDRVAARPITRGTPISWELLAAPLRRVG